MRYLIFKLSMPSAASWNGNWSGRGDLLVIGKSFLKKSIIPDPLIKKGYYTYDFGDGWVAGVTITEVDNAEYKNILKRSKGFCGYDWMVESIINHGEIQTGGKV